MLNAFKRLFAARPHASRPADDTIEFDEHRTGCPLVALQRSCADMRSKFRCPHFRPRTDQHGSRQGSATRCNLAARDDALMANARRIADVEAAIERTAAREGLLLAGIVANVERLAAAQEAQMAEIARIVGAREPSIDAEPPARVH